MSPPITAPAGPRPTAPVLPASGPPPGPSGTEPTPPGGGDGYRFARPSDPTAPQGSRLDPAELPRFRAELALAHANGTSAAPKRAARRAPDLAELARNPGEAHAQWRRLGPKQRERVLDGMAKHYGQDFANRFQDARKTGRTSDLTRTYGSGVGPSEAKLRRDGYKPYARGPYNEIWVHPSGEMVQKVLDTGPSKTGAVAPKPALDPIVEDQKAAVEGMQAWFDELKGMNKDSPDYRQAHTDFWAGLTKERDDLKATLADPKLDPAVRKGLEESLAAVEALNERRHAELPQEVVQASGTTAVVFGKWLYVQDN